MKIKLFENYYNCRNVREFISIYKDIFLFKEYYFFTNKKSPSIIDCGAHIGIPVIYFKKLYPNAKIIAFEANPQTYSFLEKNVSDNRLKNVQTHNVALSSKKGFISFYAHKYGWNWGDAGVKNSWYSSKTYKTISVPTERLSTYINSTVDLLKIDIEGMEVEVLKEIQKKLYLVNEIIVEFHGSKRNKKNTLELLLKILEKNKFSFTMRYPYTLLNPFNRNLSLHEVEKKDPYFLIIRAKKQ